MSDREIDFVTTLITCKDRVVYLLEHYPKARDNDKYLYLIYLRKFTDVTKLYDLSFDKFAAYIMTDEVPTPETIRRLRAKFQEAGQWRGELYEKRHKAAEGVRQWALEI